MATSLLSAGFRTGDIDLRRLTSATLSFRVPIFLSRSFRSYNKQCNIIFRETTTIEIFNWRFGMFEKRSNLCLNIFLETIITTTTSAPSKSLLICSTLVFVNLCLNVRTTIVQDLTTVKRLTQILLLLLHGNRLWNSCRRGLLSALSQEWILKAQQFKTFFGHLFQDEKEMIRS